MRYFRLLPWLSFFIAGCNGCKDQGNSENRIDTTINTPPLDTVTTTVPTEPLKPDTGTGNAGSKKTETSAESPSVKTKDPGYLAKIDQYLVSKPEFTPAAGGGFTNAAIQLTNTLKNATFITATVEVSVLNDDNSLVSTDYYNAVNIEPGETKRIPIPNKSKGSRFVMHVVKVKSNELTNGESVMTGVHFQQK